LPYLGQVFLLDHPTSQDYPENTMRIAILYGSTTGKTEAVAQMLQLHFPNADLLRVATSRASDLAKYDAVLLGTSTWGTGALQEDWRRRLTEFPAECLKGKILAFFGLGDKIAFPETFCAALSQLDALYAPAASQVLGGTGLTLDDDNQGLLTEGKVAGWADRLKSEGLG